MDGTNAAERPEPVELESASPAASTGQRTSDRRTAPAAAPAPAPNPAPPAPKAPGNPRKALILLAIALTAGGIGARYGYQWYTHDRFFVTTDNAYVTADITQIAAKVPGYIAEIAVSENSRVKAGDVLARIDGGDYELAVRAAREKLDSQRATIERIARQAEAARMAVVQAKAQAESTRATLARANAEFGRQAELSTARFASLSALDAARAARDTASASVRAADASVSQAEANVLVTEAQRAEAVSVLAEQKTTLAKAERDLSFTEIRAPVGGIVGTRAVEIGSYVQAGSRITGLVASGKTEIDANFKETQIAGLKPGAPVEVRADAFDGRVFPGKLVSLSPATGAVFSLLPPENATGNFTKIVQRLPVRIKVEDPEGLLRTGLSVDVAVDRRSAP
jgi:membrane fusion protein, multidrug efflux system